MLLLTVLAVRSLTGNTFETFSYQAIIFLWLALALSDERSDRKHEMAVGSARAGVLRCAILILHSRYLSGATSGENRVVDDEARLLAEGGHDVDVWDPAPSDARGLRLVGTAARAIWSTGGDGPRPWPDPTVEGRDRSLSQSLPDSCRRPCCGPRAEKAPRW